MAVHVSNSTLPRHTVHALRLDRCIKLTAAGVVFLIGASCAAAVARDAATPPGTIETKAKHALLMDADANLVLFEKDADALVPPASMSKLMTLAVVFRELKAGHITL